MYLHEVARFENVSESHVSLFHMSDTGITIIQLAHFPHLHDSIIVSATTIDPGLREFRNTLSIMEGHGIIVEKGPKNRFLGTKRYTKDMDNQRLPTTCLNMRTEVTMRFEKVHTLPNQDSALSFQSRWRQKAGHVLRELGLPCMNASCTYLTWKAPSAFSSGINTWTSGDN